MFKFGYITYLASIVVSSIGFLVYLFWLVGRKFSYWSKIDENPNYEYWNVSYQDNLAMYKIVIPIVITLGIITGCYFIFKGLNKSKIWALVTLGLYFISALVVIYHTYFLIKDIEWVYFPNSPYKMYHMYISAPVIISSGVLLVSLILQLIIKRKL